MKTKTTVRLTILVCGGTLVVAIAFWAKTYSSADSRTAAAVSCRVDALFAKGKIDPFAEAYSAETTPALRDSITKDQWQQLDDAIETNLGRLNQKALTQLDVKRTNATVVVEAAYDAWFEKGDATISLRYEIVGERWLLGQLFVDSPLLPNSKSGELAKTTCTSKERASSK
jgi:hypothetical protein